MIPTLAPARSRGARQPLFVGSEPRTRSTRSWAFALSFLAVGLASSGEPALSDVLRWGAPDDTRHAPPDALVLHFDANGDLVNESSRRGMGSGEVAEEFSGSAVGSAQQAYPGAGQHKGLAAQLPALRLTTSRHEGHAILAALDLSPREYVLSGVPDKT